MVFLHIRVSRADLESSVINVISCRHLLGVFVALATVSSPCVASAASGPDPAPPTSRVSPQPDPAGRPKSSPRAATRVVPRATPRAQSRTRASTPQKSTRRAPVQPAPRKKPLPMKTPATAGTPSTPTAAPTAVTTPQPRTTRAAFPPRATASDDDRRWLMIATLGLLVAASASLLTMTRQIVRGP